MGKKVYFLLLFVSFLLFQLNYFELEVSSNDINSSLIGLTIDGSVTNTFPNIDSGLSIGSIECDKGANGVWDYNNWLLKVRNITQSRTKCQVNFVSKYSEHILDGNDPVLKDGLIPVIINDDGSVTKSSLGWKWYEYGNQEWANAVILNNEYEEYYDGDVIPEDAIESYFVWIPRYRYQLFNVDNGNYTELIDESLLTNKAQVINIEFENKERAKSTGSTVGSWLTHPAFTAFETNGMWVGKFETGYKSASTKEEAEKNVNEPESIQIKPNVYSWRGIQVVNAYSSSYNYRREMNSHMMKNTEWGAVAYLQHSKYGSQKSVRINNNENYITGYASVVEPTCGYTGTNEDCNKYESTLPKVDGNDTVNYLNPTSVYASTTNNYSGIYDLSGGSWEYVMGVMLSSDNITPCSGRNETFHSGFNGPYCDVGQTSSKIDGKNFPTDSRYYDVYDYAKVDERYDRRILGDATGEMGPFVDRTYTNSRVRQISSWYADEAWFVSSALSWFCRGHTFHGGSGAGVFAFSYNAGSVNVYDSYRIILVF